MIARLAELLAYLVPQKNALSIINTHLPSVMIALLNPIHLW